MIPIDPFMTGGHAHVHAYAESDESSFAGPKHWREPESSPVVTKGRSVIRECDLSVMKYFTPLLYCKLNGLYIKNDKEIDEATHDWDVRIEEYNRDVMPHMPDWVQDYAAKFWWLHDAKVEVVNKSDECPDQPNLEQITIRFVPDESHKVDSLRPTLVTFRAVWINNRVVLPESLRTPNPNWVELLYDEFGSDMVAHGTEEIFYHFYCSNGQEYSLEGLYDIRWEEEVEDGLIELNPIQLPTDRELEERERFKEGLKALAASPHPEREATEDNVSPQKPTGGPSGKSKGKHRLFTALFWVDDYLFCEQIRSKDWSTVWGDFKSLVGGDDYELVHDAREITSWGDGINLFSKDTRNVAVGRFWLNGQQIEVSLVNTKRGRPPGDEIFDGQPTYIET